MIAPLRVGGLVPLSTTDYPDQLAAVVFCQGCPWRCDYCHNPHLQPPTRRAAIRWDTIRQFLGRRQGLLDAVVFSGGEPTAQAGLAGAAAEAKALGFRVGLHTAGVFPRRLAAALPFVDWVGMDVKAPFHRYDEITGVPGSGRRAHRSVRMLIASGINCEFRTTTHRALLTRADLVDLAATLAALGARHYAIQEFRAHGCRSQDLNAAGGGHHVDMTLISELGLNFDTLTVRRA